MHKNNMIRLGLLVVRMCLTINVAFAEDEPLSPAMEKGWKSFGQGDYKSAIRYSTERIAGDPQSSDVVDAYNMRGSAYNNTGRFSKAIADYSQSLKLKPEQWETYYFRAHSYDAKGDYGNAISDYNRAISLGPTTQVGTVNAYNDLAWLFATCPEKRFRNGKQAMESASAAWEASMKKQHNVMDTLAAAYAESGDFENAVKWEQEFLATPDLEKSNVKDAQKRLALYQAQKPYIEKN